MTSAKEGKVIRPMLFIRVWGWLTLFSARSSLILGAVAILLLGLLLTMTAIARYAGVIMFGGVELSELMMIAVSCLGLAYLQRIKRHVMIDTFTSRLSEKKNVVLSCFTLFLSLAFTILMFWRLLIVTQDKWEHGDWTAGMVNLVWWPWYLIASVSFFFLIIVLITDLAQSIVNWRELARKQEDTSS